MTDDPDDTAKGEEAKKARQQEPVPNPADRGKGPGRRQAKTEPLTVGVTRSKALEAVADVTYPFVYDLNYPMAYLHMWSECYQNILKYLGIVAAGILTVTVSFLFEHLATAPSEAVFAPGVRVSFKASFALLGASLVFVLFARIFTYNWFKIGLTRTVRQAQFNMDDVVKAEFDSYDIMGITMATWGTLSLSFGLLAGIVLCVAVGFYIRAAWFVLEAFL